MFGVLERLGPLSSVCCPPLRLLISTLKRFAGSRSLHADSLAASDLKQSDFTRHGQRQRDWNLWSWLAERCERSSGSVDSAATTRGSVSAGCLLPQAAGGPTMHAYICTYSGAFMQLRRASR